MKTLIQSVAKGTMLGALALFGSFFGTARAEGPVYKNDPMIRNLMALTYRAPAAQMAVPRELTRNDIKKLTATAKSAADHMKVARYYWEKADGLDAQAAGYEEAAAAYRHGPIVKNLMAPNAPARYEFFAKGFREQSKADRDLAASHEKSANSYGAAL
jgi:hypothetical protein